MTSEHEEARRFYLEQLTWIQEQKRIYEEIEALLLEMKDIAIEASDTSLTDVERENLQEIMDGLNKQVEVLYRQFDSIH